SRSGMADVAIALDDTLGDPFVNPAKMGNVRVGTVFMLPFTHGVTSGSGGGHTLPVGGFANAGDWAGGALFALQQLNHGFGAAISARTASNQYATMAVARR